MDPLDNLPWYFTPDSLPPPLIDTDRVEKYRPTTLNDVVGNEEIVSRLRIIAQSGNMPHLLLAVPTCIHTFKTNLMINVGPAWLWQDDKHHVLG